MISPTDYQFLGQLLHDQIGLALGPGKEYLLESRLTPVALQHGFGTLAELVAALRARPDRSALHSVCEAMTTNESSFFRDGTPFKVLREKVLPSLLESRRLTRRLRIWCAAASTGQEPYSIAMVLSEMSAALQGWQVEIVGTDYCRPALARAREGVYNHFEVQRGLPIQHLSRFFSQKGADWQISEQLRRMVTYREGNLLEPFTALGRFDIIFCRNVLIYFDVATKSDVLDRMAQQLAPDGILFLGGSETAMGLTSRVERLPDAATSVYRPVSAAGKLSLAS